MRLSRAATIAGAIAFLLVQAAVAFGSFVVASIRCCGSAHRAWPADAGEWLGVAIFAVVMIIPAALVGLGTAIGVESIRLAIGILREWRRN